MSSKQITGGFYGRWLFWLMLLIGVLTAGCNSATSPTEPTSSLTDTEIEYRLFQLANQVRQSGGVEPLLTVDERIGDVARRHSWDMRDLGFLGHVHPDGTTLRQRLEGAGIEFRRAAENIAQVTNTSNPASFAHELLMDSERHRANILDPRFSLIGVGVARTGDTFWITQIFIQP